MDIAVDGYNENNGHDYDDGDAGGGDDSNDDDDVGCLSFLHLPFRPVGPGVAVEKMDRMKIIKRRLSMSLRSARPVDDSLSELAEQMALDEPSAARDNGEKCEQLHLHPLTHRYIAPQQMPPHNHKIHERGLKTLQHTLKLEKTSSLRACVCIIHPVQYINILYVRTVS